jgi:hypothetical protein
VYQSGTNVWSAAKSDASATVASAVALVYDANNIDIYLVGSIPYAAGGLTPQQFYYVSDSVAGTWTPTRPTTLSSYDNMLLQATAANQVFVLPYRPVAVSGNAASSNWYLTEVDFGSTGLWKNKTFTISNASVTTSSTIEVHACGIAATGRYSDENEMDPINWIAVPGTGQFTLIAAPTAGAVAGKFKVSYSF